MSYSEQYFPPNHFDIRNNRLHPHLKSTLEDAHHQNPRFKNKLQTIHEDDELELSQEVLDELKIINKAQRNIVCIKAYSKFFLKTILVVIVLCFFLGVGVDFAYEKRQVFNHRQKLIKECERNYMVYGCEKEDLGEDLGKFCSNLKQSIETEQNKTPKFFDIDAMNQMKEKVVQALISSSAYFVFGFCALLLLK